MRDLDGAFEHDVHDVSALFALRIDDLTRLLRDHHALVDRLGELQPLAMPQILEDSDAIDELLHLVLLQHFTQVAHGADEVLAAHPQE